MKNKKIINICILMVIICFALSGCNDKENKNVATSTDTEISEEVTTEKADKNTTETTTNKVTTEESKTTEVEDKTTAATTEAQKPATTQQATTESPKPTTTQQATTEAPKPQTTQAPATTQATTEAPSTTEHQHTWESVGHTETHDYRSDTGADVTGQQISIVDGQRCIITGYNTGYECTVCGFRGTNTEVYNHVFDAHNGDSSSGTYRDPIYVTVNQKSVYVEDYQRCTTCGATK